MITYMSIIVSILLSVVVSLFTILIQLSSCKPFEIYSGLYYYIRRSTSNPRQHFGNKKSDTLYLTYNRDNSDTTNDIS